MSRNTLSISFIIVISILVPHFSAAAQDSSRVQKLGRVLDSLATAATQIPRDTFDPEVILAVTGSDADKIFSWVRDETTLVPYRGALRGATGVLMDRVGNSLDRALLLGDLLQRRRHTVRLAHGQLSARQTMELLSGLRVPPIPRPRADAVASKEGLESAAQQLGIDLKPAKALLLKAAEQRDFMAIQLPQRVQAQTSAIYASLGSPRSDAARERTEQQQALQDHWWIQIQQKGIWSNFDPTLSNVKPGDALTPATDTLSFVPLAQLPETLVQSVQVRVVLECTESGKLAEHRLVESGRLLPATLLGQHVTLGHVPVNWNKIVNSKDKTALTAAIRNQNRWFPVLTVGTKSIIDRDFTAACKIGTARPASLGIANSAADRFDKVGDVLGGIPSTIDPAPAITDNICHGHRPVARVRCPRPRHTRPDISPPYI